MNQSISAQQLRPVVFSLCGRQRYHDAIKIVIAFARKGYIDFDAADECSKSAVAFGDAAAAKMLAEEIHKLASQNWRSWQLHYKAYHADQRWSEAYDALCQVERYSDGVNDEFYLGKAEVLERLLRPSDATDELGKIRDPNSPLIISRYALLKATILAQEKQHQEVVDYLTPLLEELPADIYAASCWKLCGRSLDALSRFDQAYSALAHGNALQAKIENLVIQNNAVRRRVEVFRKLFRSDWVSDWSAVDPDNDAPVFLVGFPRSGTTLLEQVLDAHEGVQAMEEPQTIASVLKQMAALLQAQAAMKSPALSKESWLNQWLRSFEMMKDLSHDQVLKFRETYFSVVDREVKRDNKKMLLDKMPLNSVDIGVILRIFPNAKFVVSLRHPCDCVLSGHMQNFKMNDAMANFLDLDNAASFYKHVMKLLWQYEEVFDLKDRMHYIRYEDLVMDLEGEARKVLDFLGLPWDDAVLNYDEHAKQRGTLATPSYQGVTQKIYDSSRERWRHYAQWMEPVLPHFREAAERYGYDLTIK